MSAAKPLRRFFILTIFLCTAMVLAQQLISFRKISVNDGLSQSTITTIMQDSRGYIWIGTDDGLNRYDGYEFRIFRHDVSDSNSISSSQVGYIQEDWEQNIWVTARYSIDCYNPRTNRFTHYLHDDGRPESINGAYIQSLNVQDSNHIWIGTDKGLEILDRKTGNFTHLVYGNRTDMLPGVIVSGLYLQSDEMMVATDSGICYVNTETFAVRQSGFPPMKCHRILKDKTGNVFVTADTSVYRYDPVHKTMKECAHGNYDSPRGPFPSYRMTIIDTDNENNIWAGGWLALSPVIISDSGIKHKSFFSNAKWPSGSTALLIDNSQNIWSGGEGSEVMTGSVYASRFISYQTIAPGQSNDIVNPVWSCSEDTNGRFWITAQNSVHRIDPRTGENKVYRNNKDNPRSFPSEGSFHSLCDSKGRVWIDGAMCLCYYNEETDDFDVYRNIKGDSTSHPPRNGSYIYETKNGDIWLGTYGYSMVKFDPASRKFRPFRQPKGSKYAPSSTVVRSIFEDVDGNLWVGTTDGFDRFDPSEGKYYRMLDNTGYLGDVNGIQQTESGFLWLGSSQNGLLKFDISQQKVVKQYLQSDGLANNCIYEIEKDSSGLLWISTNHGLSRFDPSTETFRNYDHSDGIQHNEFSGGAGRFTKTGWMLFGCSNGFTAFRPENMSDNPYPPKVLITQLRLFNKEVGIGRDDATCNDSAVFRITEADSVYTLPIDISFVQNLELDYDQNFLSFDFVALHFTSPEKNSYAYLMEGLEDKWNNTGQKRTATYTNLPPGDYTFRVKAANCDGVWNETGRSLHIVINPPWWETLWFRIFAVLLIIAGIAGFIRFRTATLRKRQKELEKTVKERTAEVVARNEEITVQKHMVEEKQKEIIDSINYAERIQRALLASDKLLRDNLGEHFVLFKPKDIVAGDFYWGTVVPDGFILITADCTGHGVPGAFMSLLNISKLSETIAEKKITRPDLVLNNVRSEIIRSLNPNAGDNSQDGMDCILCKFDLKNKKLEYAAANNGFYIVRNGELITCGADKMPVGKSHDDKTAFTLHTVQLQSGDVVYTLTDGYPDQFGGPKGKKFKYKQLEEMLVDIAVLPVEQQKQKLSTALDDWRGNLEQVDDVCIIGIWVR